MTSVGSQISKLSHKCFRAMLKKFRRKKKRQLLAKALQEKELLEQKQRERSPNYQYKEEEKRRNQALWEEFEERERVRKNKSWLIKEEQAQLEFRKKQNMLELEKIRLEEERKSILAEFEEKQNLENIIVEADRKAKLKKEEALQEALSGLPEGNEPWHNPIAPPSFNNPVQERDQCQFFAKTGCCRFGDRCSRGHIHPPVSCTILIRGMYSHFSIGQTGRDDYDTDIALEFEDKETYQDFKDFYMDVLPEFQKFGRVVQFKVCSNHEPHLRGNVYVQFSHEDEALEAYKSFNGRYYAGKQLTCDFTHIIKWKSAICGLSKRKTCPKGINCNFLHVFKNPGNEFWEADRDLSPLGNSSKRGRRFQRNGSSRPRQYNENSHRHYGRTSYRHDYRDDYYDDEYYDDYKRRDSVDRSSERRYRNSERSYRHRDSRSRTRSPLSPYSSDSSEKHSSQKRKKSKKKSKKSKKSKRKHSRSRSPLPEQLNDE